jgi:D-2-hydroxyacid dehydrogenase (NADP+)
VVESALIEALQAGRIAGAAFDCTDREPPEVSSPLWSAPSVFITPHIGGETRGYEANANEILVENLQRMWTRCATRWCEGQAGPGMCQRIW